MSSFTGSMGGSPMASFQTTTELAHVTDPSWHGLPARAFCGFATRCMGKMPMPQLIIALCFVQLASATRSSAAEPATTQSAAATTQTPGVLAAEMIFEHAPFPSCHASTIVQTTDGQIAAAWFGGTRERDPDVCIYVSRLVDGKWTEPAQVADGVQPAGSNPPRLPTWNPVLFQVPDGPLMLFYKIGPSPALWWGMYLTSTDDGKTWSAPTRLPEPLLGPIKDKPIVLPSGRIISPSSVENDGSKIHFELSDDSGKTWKKVAVPQEKTWHAIQPTILLHPGDAGGPPKLQALCRTKEEVIGETWSTDGGNTWSPLAATSLPNPGSGIDAVTLADGRQLLVYNPTKTGRTPLVVALSKDGKTWHDVLTLENIPGQYSYPGVIQTKDGIVRIVYTYQRKTIKYVALDPSKFE